ncbi:MAG: WD40/YVTN/BNR-like repeat-containing protein [Sphingobacteriales bacterium]|jgi:photosystem II stability/assembly factor-like uncharacterized protein
MKKLIILFAIGVGLSAQAQKQVDINTLKAMQPRSIGPAGMSGRITSIDAVVSDPNTIVIGSASGGVFKSTNGGDTWTPIFDEQANLNIGSVAIQQSNPDVIWVGTGEGNPRNSLNLGDGIYKSTDGGRSWKKMGLEKTMNIHRILIHPTNPDIIYAGVIGNPYAEHADRGVFKTIDGGQTWEKILHTNDTSGVADMIMDPANPDKLFVAMWQHRRTPWSFMSGGPGSGLFMTIDGGKNWKKLDKSSGLPDGPLGRIGLGVARSNPKRVYALVEATKNGLYRSDDGGLSWELVNSDPRWVTNRPFYFQDLAVDPQNENRIYFIYQIISYSMDGGKTFEQLPEGSGLHADHHALWINPKDGRLMYNGNDGGFGISRDRGMTWLAESSLPLGQYYHINVDNQVPYNVMGGLQDNGSWHGPGYTFKSGGILNEYWTSVQGGDGFDVMADPSDPNWIYGMSQGGNLGKYNLVTGERSTIRPPAEDPKKPYRFNWNAALAQDPFDPNTIYYGSHLLHKSVNKGNSWETISSDLTTNDSSKIDQSNNGGLSIDITGAESYCTIITIAPSPKQQGVIWVGTDDGNVQLTRDGGKNWTNFRGKIPGMPIGAWIPQIQTSKHHAGEAFVVANDYRRGDFKPYIFRTTDFGKTWTRLVDEKKVRGYALCVIQDPAEPNLIFAGTEHGLWVSFDNGMHFQQWKNGYPSVSTYDMAIQEREADLVIATFGRALYILDNIRPLRAIAANKGVMPAEKRLTAFPIGEAWQYNVRNAPGMENAAWGIYQGTNKKRGVPLTYYIHPLPQDSSAKGLDSIKVSIYNMKNELVRNLKVKADTGLNVRMWSFEQNGFRMAGSMRGGGTPGGLPVLAGTYKVVYSLGKHADSSTVVVKDDPATTDKTAEKLAKAAMVERIKKINDRLLMAMDRLNESDEVVKKIEAQLTNVNGKEADSLRKATKSIKEAMKALREYMSGKPKEKQGYYGGFASDVTPLSQLNIAYRYTLGKATAPGEQEEKLLQLADKMSAEAIEKVNKFFNDTWKAYRQLAESTKLNLFKDYSPISAN